MSDDFEQNKEPVNPTVTFEFDLEKRGHRVRIEGNIPHADIVNALELFKAQILHAQLAAMMQQNSPNRRIVFPNGPIR